MEENKKRISPGIFGIIALCFFLPFASLSCQGNTMASVSAMNLVTGTTIEGQQVPAEPLAIILFLLTLAGLGLGFMKLKNKDLSAAVVGAVAFILTIILKSGIEDEVTGESYGAFQVESEIGYMAMLFLFLVATGINIYNWRVKPADPDSIFCASCGTKNPTANHRCENCNHSLSGW